MQLVNGRAGPAPARARAAAGAWIRRAAAALGDWVERVPARDALERRMAASAQIACAAAAVVLVSVPVSLYRFGWSGTPGLRFVAAGIIAPCLLAAAVLLRSGRIRLGMAVVVAASVLYAAAQFVWGGLHQSALIQRVIPIPLILAALLIGRRALWLSSGALALALAAAELRDRGLLWGHGPRPTAPPIYGLLGSSLIVIAIAAVLLDRFGITLRAALQSAESRESALRESEERFRTAFRMSPDPMTLSRLSDLSVVAVNGAFTEASSWTEGEVLGRTLEEFGVYADEGDRGEVLAALGRGETVQNREMRFRTRDGRLLTGLLSARLTTVAGEPHVLAAVRDVTGWKQVQAERDRLAEELRQAQKMEAIGRLAAGVAHDFNNILTAILAAAQDIEDDLPRTGRHRAGTESIRRDAQRAARLTRELLAVGKRESGTPQRIRVGEQLEQLRGILARHLGAGVALRLEAQAGEWPVFIDPVQLERVVVNLAMNARDAMPGGGTLTLRTANLSRPAGTPPGDWVLLDVRDTGVGIPAGLLSRIFEPFFTTKGPEKGTGLGLAAAHGIVSRAGGVVQVESEPGRGTRFLIHLPRAPEAAPTPRP